MSAMLIELLPQSKL